MSDVSTAPTHIFDEVFWKTAAAVVDEALALDPDNREAWRVRFDLLFAVELYEAALDAANTLLALDASDAMAHWCRAWALSKLNRFGEGLDAADRAIALAPDRRVDSAGSANESEAPAQRSAVVPCAGPPRAHERRPR